MSTILEKNKDSGYLYCLYNIQFRSYGKFIFKIGRTNDLKTRLKYYTTSYIEPSYFVCISDRMFENSRHAEKLVFYILKNYRLRDKREFFHVTPEKIRCVFESVSNLSDKTIKDLYNSILNKSCPTELLSKINEDQEEDYIEKSINYRDWLDEFFNKFYFRPKDPSKYPGYISPEHTLLSNLIKNIKD